MSARLHEGASEYLRCAASERHGWPLIIREGVGEGQRDLVDEGMRWVIGIRVLDVAQCGSVDNLGDGTARELWGGGVPGCAKTSGGEGRTAGRD